MWAKLSGLVSGLFSEEQPDPPSPLKELRTMANVNLNWVLPTTRESQKPLSLGEIDYVEIFMSSDGGQNYGSYDKFEPNILNTTITDLEAGDWFFYGVVVDIGGKVSKPVKVSLNVPDTSPPGSLLSLTIDLSQ